MRSISSGDAMQLETGTQPDTSSFIILDASASGTDEGGNILFEDISLVTQQTILITILHFQMMLKLVVRPSQRIRLTIN